MSLPSSGNQGPLFRKPRADIYTALLFIALVALILGSVAAYLEIKDYGEAPFQGGPSVSIGAGDVEGIAMARPLVNEEMAKDQWPSARFAPSCFGFGHCFAI